MNTKSSAKSAERRKAMLAVVGIWKDRSEFSEPAKYVRGLRRDDSPVHSLPA